MLQTQTEKMKYIAEEMSITLHLATSLTDSFPARVLARHILIRAKDFIDLARSLRQPLKAAGYSTTDYHKTKEAYADEFEEYFKVARHKLGAHVQDFDFGKRIDLWNDIEGVVSENGK